MSRKKWEKSQLWKKVISGTISLSMFLSFFPIQPTQAYNVTTKGSLEELKAWVENYQNELSDMAVGVNPIKEGVDVTDVEYQSIIVEFKALPRITARALEDEGSKKSTKDEVEENHKEFNKFIAAKGQEKNASTYTIDHSYFETFNGVAMKVRGIDIPKLLESGVVKSIWKDEAAFLDPSYKELREGSNPESRMASSTPLIEVDKLRAQGINGEGIKVGVIDTGIDYNHPDLKGNYKDGGYDFVDNDNDPMETTYEQWKNSSDPEFGSQGTSYYTSHGTHVSGTIAANGGNTGNEFAVTGIAPNAELYGYRVLGPYGVGSASDIVAAIEQSVEDGMDVINLSLGVTTTSPLYPSSIACNNAAIAGVVPVVANGNSGPNFSTLGSPGTSPLAISVGASTNKIIIDKFNITINNETSLDAQLLARPYDSIEGLDDKEYEIVYGKYGLGNELEGIDAKGKILLLDRGYLSFLEKFNAAKKLEAAAVIIINNVPGEINLYLGEGEGRVPGISMSMESGEVLKKALGISAEQSENSEVLSEEEAQAESQEVVQGNEVQEEPVQEEAVKQEVNTVKIEFNGKTNTTADELAQFSSRGPSSDETIKPDVTAPGVGIFSTYPEYINSPGEGIDYSTAYARIDGTSMASPHVAGVVALMLQANKALTPADVKVALMNTAEPLVHEYGVNEIGAGRINAYNAVHNDISIKVIDTAVSLDDTDNKKDIDYITGSMSFDRVSKSENDSEKQLPIEIKNNGDNEKKFTVEVQYLGENVKAMDAEKNGVVLNLPKEITVSAGSVEKLTASILVPTSAELGRYEGFVILKNVNDETEDYRVPFSVKHLTPGFESINYSRPAVSNDLELMHFAKELGISAKINVSSPMSTVDVYVQDYETKERIGYSGSMDISYIPAGYGDIVRIINGRVSCFPIDKDGNVEYMMSSLKEGKYTLEVVGNDLDTDQQYVKTFDFLVDNQDVVLDMQLEPGVHELTDDMFTVEDHMGMDYEAFWLKGNASDNSTSILQDMGYKIDSSDIKVIGFVHGSPFARVPVDTEGNFKFGIEKYDIEYGMLEFSPMPTDIATSQNLFLPPRYFFVKAGSSYFGTSLDKDIMKEGENVTATIKGVRVTGSTFTTQLDYANPFKIVDIRVSNELQEILDNNGYKAVITKDLTGRSSKKLILELNIVDGEGNNVDVEGDLDLIDIEFNLADASEYEYYREYFQCREMKVNNKDGEETHNFMTGFYEGVDVKLQEGMLKAFPAAEGEYERTVNLEHNYELDKYYWVEDTAGNKYEVAYDENSGEYRAYNLPKTTEELMLVSALPGHFKKVGKFVPSRTVNDELLGKVYYLLGSEFYRSLLGGDVNGDGLVDILDAIEVEKYYGSEVDFHETPVDFNFDGKVDIYDMDYIVYNFGRGNEQVVGKGTPQEEYEGRTLDNVLKACGYSDEIRLEGMDIDKTSIKLEVGETDKINATLTPSNVPGVEILWSSDNEAAVTVDSEGNVTAVSPGYAVIRIMTNDGKAILNTFVEVVENGQSVEIEEIIAENPVKEVYVGEELEFNFDIKPYNSLANNVTYVASNDTVAVKDGKGVANNVGTAFVTATINGSDYVTWEVIVKERPVESIKLDKNELKLNEGEEAQLEVIFDPNNATNKNVTWTSSDEKVATVVDGKVVAVKKGEAVITVTSEDGAHTDTCKVTVEKKAEPNPEIALKSIKLNKNKLTLDMGAKEQLKVTFKPEDATNKNVTWKSSNEKVAKVVNGEVVAVAKGVATITVTSEEGKLTDTCNVTVKGKDGSLPQTGAAAGASMALAMGAIAVGAGVVTFRRKREE